MTTCCDYFQQSTNEYTRFPAFYIEPLDDCNNKAYYLGTNGTEYKVGTLLKFDATVNTVVPATVVGSPDTFEDVIGVSLSDVTSDGTDETCIFVARTGRYNWSKIADNLGYDPTDKAQWWKYHQAAAKANIYVEFK